MEKLEVQLLDEQKMSIRYDQSFTAYLNAEQYIKVWGAVLDYSSITSGHSYLTNTTINKDPALKTIVDYLAMVTKNNPYLWKDETSGKCLKVNPYVRTSVRPTLEGQRASQASLRTQPFRPQSQPGRRIIMHLTYCSQSGV